MVAAPVSAFEMYSQMKSNKANKKKSLKSKHKANNRVKINPMVAAELRKVASDVAKTKEHTSKKLHNDLLTTEEPSVSVVTVSKQDSKAMKKDRLAMDSAKLKKKTKNMKNNGSTSKEIVSLSEEQVVPNHQCDQATKKSTKKVTHPNESSSQKPAVKRSSPKSAKHRTISLTDSESSIEVAEKFFSWMMDPISKENFLSLYWEKRPVHISREGNRDYYSGILSTSAIDDMLRKHNILYGKNVDITSYVDGKRETLNSAGRAQAAVVWDYYRNGCSIRLLNPQTYHIQLRELNTRLQEIFGSFVGANAYLTPPNSQGFAPHYDDIEAFVLQIEGSKMWRVYAPRSLDEKLPRTSSGNFSQEEIGKPILEVHVKAGDLLYFPRGYIHQATTVPGEHSLHVTVSTYQRNAWADLLEKLVPVALSNAIEEDEEFREGMPFDVMQHIGVVHSDSESPEREAIMKKIKKLFNKLFNSAPVDAAADQLAKNYIHDLLPPCLSSDEKHCSVLHNSERMVTAGKLVGAVALSLETCIRLTRSNVLRLVSEEEPDSMKIYHSMENSLEYHGEEIQCIEIPLHMAQAVEHLIHSYPKFTSIDELPLEENSDKVQIATELWERGLVLTEKPLPQVSVD